MNFRPDSSHFTYADLEPIDIHRLDRGQLRSRESEMLHSVGLRPTAQRLVLTRLLFGNGDRHVTAEMLYEEASRSNVQISLATVYNTLNHFAELGMVRRVSIDGSKTYFDTNVGDHHHFYLENKHELIDVPLDHIALGGLPEIPEGYEISRIDMVVRLRRKSRG
ncbi:Fur family iron response transcriptional regulator [Rhodopseudomonas thermotolerans]|uniref:Ferric uptake regulation protein n=2 Tax=Rhodopseudomonas TaxID=1073 RepID=A0A336JRQ1_9BRAD|nr:Fur family iron response transcriptional regulator [Rhodopseudomonas pentothenatexigens]REF94046.1 Fur family iron response transcriptional regulator [Rhodopseudomonas thermotolerans]SSW91373.1 Fur family iron response transcriptional regulator [Rhodopseudomonas pentothenatexigens]